ncbi:MAG: hypothetical protein D6702_04450 [Planctomycetota bacterium]|nr:MAG: hypothetical protein D6702_04450 [Planctomycetota bacterium]
MPQAAESAALRKILRRLGRDTFKIPARPPGMPVLERLLALVMQGEDGSYAQADKAVKALRAAYANWNEVRVARRFEVVDVLRRKHIGMAEVRADRAQELLRRVFGLQNHLDLDWMDDCTSERRERTLVALQMLPPVTGPVLDLDAREGEELPVTTDHKRLLSRLGLVPACPKEEDVRRLLGVVGSGEKAVAADLALRAHARAVCESKHPHCRRCPLLDLCPHGRKQMGKASFEAALAELGLKTPPAARKSSRKASGARKTTRRKSTARKSG